MILGKIVGKTTTTKFQFIAETEINKFEYVQVYHKKYDYVLAQIIELVRDSEQLIAKCIIIGYKDEDNRLTGILDPFEIKSEVLYAEDDFVKKIIEIDSEKGAYIGKLKGRDIKIFIDLQNLLTKHLAVLAKSGAGKSYFTGVLLEEIIGQNVPLLLIDTHGEYSSLNTKNNNQKDLGRMFDFGISADSFKSKIKEFGNKNLNPECIDLKLKNVFTSQEILDLIPDKLSNQQKSVLLSAMDDVDKISLDELIDLLEFEESYHKYQLISALKSVLNYGIFSYNGNDFSDFINKGSCTIINLRGIPPNVQEIIVSLILKNLFELRKRNEVPPFFCLIEEAHNFCPERSFGQKKSSDIIRNIASEGRKFGLGLGIVSQRPARVDKSVLSQISTQAILKVTNPNDLKSIINSVESVSSESEDEIRNLSIGTAMIVGVVDMPLIVNVRPRKTKHGGESVDMVSQSNINLNDQLLDLDSNSDILPLIVPFSSKKDFILMSEQEVKSVKTILNPFYLCDLTEGGSILIDSISGDLVYNINSFEKKKIPNLSDLDSLDINIIKNLYSKKKLDFNSFSNLSSDIKERISNLNELGFIVKESDFFKLNDLYLFSNIKNHLVFPKIEFKEVSYCEKKDFILSADDISNLINKFSKIKSFKECYLVSYVLNN